jgi:hypothetical protein
MYGAILSLSQYVFVAWYFVKDKRQIYLCLTWLTGGAGNFSVLHRVLTGSGAHPASCPKCIGGPFPQDKAAGAWSRSLTSFYCRGQEWVELYHHPQYVFMAWCLVEARGLIYFPFTLLTLRKYFAWNMYISFCRYLMYAVLLFVQICISCCWRVSYSLLLNFLAQVVLTLWPCELLRW